jgi:hypothetical protein
MPTELLVAIVAAFGLGGLLLAFLVIAFLLPDKAQWWGEIIWSAISKIWRGGNRKAVQLGVQSRLNAFAIEAAGELGRGEPTQVKIEWAPPKEEPSHFFADGRLVVRLHEHQHQDRNLMNASMFFISQTLVRRAKRYLPKRRARSVDLYAVDRLLTRTAPPAADLLHEEVMGPECDADHELGQLLVDYQRMDRINAFFPVFVRELNYLAHKVVVRPHGDQLVNDVNDLHRFLIRYSDRIIGQEINMEVQGRFLRCAVMIVALAVRRELGDRAPYVRRLRRLAAAGHETVYLIGSAVKENVAFMRGIAQEFVRESGWSDVDQRQFPTVLHGRDGSDFQSRNLLIVLRTNAPRDYIGEVEEIAEPSEVPALARVDVEAASAPDKRDSGPGSPEGNGKMQGDAR